MKKIFIFSITIFLLGILIYPSYIFAALQATPGNIISELDNTVPKTGVAQTDVATFSGQLVKGALGLTGLIFFGLMVYAGFMWMSARGEEDMVNKAKGTIKGSVIGLVVVLSAYGLTNILTERLIGGGYSGGPDATGNEPVGCCIDWRASSGEFDRGIPVQSLMTRAQCQELGTKRTGGGDQLAGPEGRGYWVFFEDIKTDNACFEQVSTYSTDWDVIPDSISND